MQKIEFGLVGIQTIGDLIGALFYTINICQLYLQRYFFYCTMDYTTGVKTDDFLFYESTDDLHSTSQYGYLGYLYRSKLST